MFYKAFAPAVYLSSVVLHELLVGAGTPARFLEIREFIARPFERTNRVVTPSHATWTVAGETLALLAAAERIALKAMPKSLVHDCLIAASCRAMGAVLLTENLRDFTRIGRYIDFKFQPPWPA